MKLKRWCVTVMDNWTKTREFWTRSGAVKYLCKQPLRGATLWEWQGVRWQAVLWAAP